MSFGSKLRDARDAGPRLDPEADAQDNAVREIFFTEPTQTINAIGVETLNNPDLLTELECFAAISLAAQAAGRTPEQGDAYALETYLPRTRHFASQAAPALHHAVGRAFGLAHELGVETMIRRASDALPANLRPAAFAVAADIILASTAPPDSQRAQLEQFQTLLGVAPRMAREIETVTGVQHLA